MSSAELQAAVKAAERAVPALLASAQDEQSLSDKLLPLLTKPWSAAATEMAKKAESAPARPSNVDALMSGVELPLLRQEDVVQCELCKRMLLREAMEKHMATCATLPIASLLEADAAGGLAGSHAKSPSRDLSGRPASGLGRPGAGSGGRASGGSDEANAPGVGGPAGGPPDPRRRSRVGGASGSRSGASGSRSGQRPISAEAEQRRLQFEHGVLTLDNVCGVPTSGEKICLRPLNCKYHSVAVKRQVEGRSRDFDEILAEFNAQQLAARKSAAAAAAASRSRRPASTHIGGYGALASGHGGYDDVGDDDGYGDGHGGGGAGHGGHGGSPHQPAPRMQGLRGGGGPAAMSYGGAPGGHLSISRPELDVPDNGWRDEWLSSMRALAPSLAAGGHRSSDGGAPSTTVRVPAPKRALASLDAFPTAQPLHIGQPMRSKRRLHGVQLSLVNGDGWKGDDLGAPSRPVGADGKGGAAGTNGGGGGPDFGGAAAGGGGLGGDAGGGPLDLQRQSDGARGGGSGGRR